VGMVPSRLLFEKYKIRIVGISKMVEGRVPSNWLFLKSTKSSFDHWLKPSRIVPTKLLLLRRRTAIDTTTVLASSILQEDAHKKE
jgi:hypothetical protein